MKLDTSTDAKGDVEECPGENMGEDNTKKDKSEDNTKKDESEDNTKKDVKEDMRLDNFINEVYTYLKKAIKGMYRFRQVMSRFLFQS